MSLSETSNAIKNDKDYVNETGSLKNFSKEVWKASCKWQRRMRARQEQAIIKLGESVAVPQSMENPNQLQMDETNYETTHTLGAMDDEDDQDEGAGHDIVEDVVQKIQEKYEGMQKELDEKDEIHQKEKEEMLEMHEKEMELQRQALGKFVVLV